MSRRRVLIAASAAGLLAMALVSPKVAVAAPSAPGQVNPALYSGLQWRNIGPDLGGRSISVTGVVGQPNVYYSGQAGGGLWKTTDGGQTWAPATDGQIASKSVGAVAVCPANSNVLYIGGGDVDLHGDMVAGDGVYKSTDAGATWTHLGLADTQFIGKIVVDPTNCRTCRGPREPMRVRLRRRSTNQDPVSPGRRT